MTGPELVTGPELMTGSGGGAALLAQLPGLAFAAALLVARVGAACMLLPLLGEAEAPATIRIGITLALVALLLPGVLPLMPAEPPDIVRTLAMVAAEVGTGLWLGWLARLVLLALPLAGQFAALATGLSNVLQPDPELGVQTAASGRLFSVAAPVLVALTGLYAWPIEALAGSYRLVPPGHLLPAADTVQSVVAAVEEFFALGLRLAAPFLVAGLVWQVTLAVVSRLTSPLQLTQAMAPAQLLGGLALLGLAAAAMLAVWQDRAAALLAALPGL